MRNVFRDAVKSLKQYFILNNNDFDTWVHEEMAPPLYKAYYRYETLFYNTRIHIRKAISSKQSLELSDFSRIVTDFEHSLEFVKDPKALELLFDYVDFWELLVLHPLI